MAKLIQEYFTDSATKFPDKAAVYVWHEEKSRIPEYKSRTFSDLEGYSNQIARYLKSKGVQRNDRVALMFMKIMSVDAIATILAILKCDAIYVPVNHSLPAERVAKILKDANVKLLVCMNYSAKALITYEPLSDFNFIEMNKNFEHRQEIDLESKASLEYKNKSDATAYIMYTSGSTGDPKGVEISHANIINATDWAVKEFGITSEDKMSQHPPFNFDLSTFDLYCAFKSGATLYPVPDNLSLFPGELIRFIEENELTIWNSVPSVMVYIWNSGLVKKGIMPSVKKIFFNGEGFPTKFLAEWMKTYPEKEFINMYGPTETTVQCSFYRIPAVPTDLTKLVPIGKATGGMEIFAVDDELYVGGKGVGKGYWNNLEKTQASFISDPRPGKTGIVYKTGDLVRLRDDGNYEFIGRKDNQVKIHGNRIELGDVDSSMYALPYVKKVAVVDIDDPDSGGKKLVAFTDTDESASPSQIKEDLAKKLPRYMIPEEIVEMHLPETSTGKVDRNQLRAYYGNKK
ncbi:MAG: amino acid adenylation protein [Parcubacteria group bacterium Gr01-1014_3]|nr:MAG: amino acid adenylation protein [Parcubacteria group bacterium Gr01-1014_3]